jgi:hypothetical protein
LFDPSIEGGERHARDDTRQHAEIAGKIAVEERRVDELLRTDDPANLFRCGVDERRLA